MNTIDTLEFQNCKIGSFSHKLMLEVKQQIVEQKESQVVFGSKKINPLYEEIRSTILAARKSAAHARFSKKSNLSEEEKEDMLMGFQTVNGFLSF